VDPDWRMNPVLLKPTGKNKSEVIVRGVSWGVKTTDEYRSLKKELFEVCQQAYQQLAAEFDLIILEGAGSIAEINLWQQDIVNMNMAEFARAPVLLVADIDRGGAFASVVGTIELLPQKWKKQVRGYVFNKFRGQEQLLQEGINILNQKWGLSCLGVVPYVPNLNLPSEDSYAISWHRDKSKPKPLLKIGIVDLPYASLLTDFEAFLIEPSVQVTFLGIESLPQDFDAVILPGSKNSLLDLQWLKEVGLFSKLKKYQGILVGICGGLQLMGDTLVDPYGIEQSAPEKQAGLSLLPVNTVYVKTKKTCQSQVTDPIFGIPLKGFEIHYGRTKPEKVFYGNKDCFGTYLHGVFENDGFRNEFLSHIYFKKTGKVKVFSSKYTWQSSIDKMADVITKTIPWQTLWMNQSQHKDPVL